ncbi:P-loop containing nucleoside triphosphate hydrolase protein, partial [Lentinula aciculospora]
YIVCLSFVTTSSSVVLSNIVNRHLNFLLLSLFAVYAYRDLWPLFTFDGIPRDEEEGIMLWLKIATLTVAAIVVPVTTPRQAYPPTIDVCNPEETASIISLLTHSYLDSFMFRRYRASTPLTQDEVPPMAEADHSDVHMADTLRILDPLSANTQHLFWGLRKAFSKMIHDTKCCWQIPSSFVAPVGIKQVLSYLENDGAGATIRPWVWVSWLFFGPFLKATFSQLFTYTSCRHMLRINGTLYYLLLQHSLRIRTDSDNLNDSKETSNNITGKLNNLVASDIPEVGGAISPFLVFLCSPVELGLSMWFLYDILQWSAFVGFAFMLLCVPLPSYLSQLMSRIQVVKKQKTDARVQSVMEALSVIRMAKLFGWEARFEAQIAAKRADELSLVRKSKLYDLLNSHINLLIPMCTMMITYAFYACFFGFPSSIVFSSMAVFEILRAKIQRLALEIPQLIKGKVALDRLDDILRKTDLLDQAITHSHTPMIGFRNSIFRWSGPINDGFELNFREDVLFLPNCINLIIGPTGSGKTSLLLALLGEMRYVPTGSDSSYNLPREGGVSYAAQESWIQNDTVRNNILFKSEFDEERYNKVLYQCGLLKDLSLFEAGDMTEVGEKGLTLSGGQKARVTLARAVYSSAQIVLLDDPLSALDVLTAKWVVDNCLKGDLMYGRTVLLVTHNIALVTPLAQNVVAIALDGRITQGGVTDVILSNPILTTQLIENKQDLETHPESFEKKLESTQKGTRGVLVRAEEMDVGHVRWDAFKLYLNGLSGHSIIFCWSLITLLLLNALNSSLQSWFLGYWSSQYESQPASSVSVLWYLSVYAALLIFAVIMDSFGFTLWTFGSIRTSHIIHRRLINSIMTSTFRWLDITPTSRIIARATADIRNIDGPLSSGIWQLFEAAVAMLVKLGSIMVFAPLFILPGIAIAILGGFFGHVYLATELPMRRMLSINQAPLAGNFNAAVAGIVSIRAFGAEDMILKETRVRIDAWMCIALPCFNANRWISIRADALAGIFTAALGAYLVYGDSGTSTANTGFSMTMAGKFGFTSLILTWVRLYNATHIEANSLERIQHYLVIDHEAEAVSEGVPPAYWPASGALRVERLSARYSREGPEILHDLTFSVRSGEHIGIVGRTGSGKSSLTLALLRAIPTSGQVFFDGISTDKLNLEALRSNITITPQVPELLSGTLRSNIDPFSEHDDSRLNDALRASGLFALQGDGEFDVQNRLGLDSEIKGGGSSNLSVGQRQIIALARAIVRGSKLLIFDEATSSIDHKTDSIIQETLRHELGNDATLLTVAHRLGTVMDYDRIMVLDDGRIVEFDSPRKLLQKEGGMFRRLVDESADRDKLYAVVNKL